MLLIKESLKEMLVVHMKMRVKRLQIMVVVGEGLSDRAEILIARMLR